MASPYPADTLFNPPRFVYAALQPSSRDNPSIMTDRAPPNRCRIVLLAPAMKGTGDERRILAALEGGDVAALVLPVPDDDEVAFQKSADALVPQAQEYGTAVLIAGDPRLAFRLKADGVHLEAPKAEIQDVIAKHHDRLMIGCNGGKTRDEALEIGETKPDYVFFGRFGYDTQPEPHRRNLALGEWWAQMVALPCVVLGGAEIGSVETVAAAGADFVALASAVFAGEHDPAEAVRQANALLDSRAPRFEA